MADLVAETARRFPDRAGMQIGPEQGTFTGLSSLSVARGLTPDGHLLCCDISEEWTSLAREYWRKAGVAGKIELRLGPALDTLRALPAGTTFDMAFIDADKGGYIGYWDELVPRIRPGGILLVDNTFSRGRILDTDPVPDAQAIAAFNDHAAADSRVTLVMLSIGDGLTIAQKH